MADNCEDCKYYKDVIFNLKGKIEKLEKELNCEYDKTDKFLAIKQERDELRKNQERNYDSWVSNGERNRKCED